ncbi:hypothetical protein [Paludibaculum fermentans]|uniref:PEP-CTERM protein-sorting domain-containing protein n=1 Tax=Paludibaculum fermentans TaxID=1473598 RepID=A0A7S7SIM7_PALFE|nr:hypothetical protein [Paludibaculum fermentans]QOY87187.1 hypothetical protein IRI77_31165 [Paludibaculum fermentans]
MKLTVLALGALLTAAAHGATLYDTLGPANSYQLSGSTIGGSYDQVVANLFDPTQGGQISQITLAMGHTSGQNLYRLDIIANNDGEGPTGANLFTLDFSLTGYLTTLNLSNGPSLQAGGLYWMVISGAGEATQGAWWGNSGGFRGTTGWHNTQPGLSASAVNWHLNGDSYLNAFRVSSGTTQDPLAAPEPSTALLAAPALLLLGWLRRRRA